MALEGWAVSLTWRQAPPKGAPSLPRRLTARLRILIPSIEVRILAGHPFHPRPGWLEAAITMVRIALRAGVRLRFIRVLKAMLKSGRTAEKQVSGRLGLFA